MPKQSELEDEFAAQLKGARIRFKRQVRLIHKRQFRADFVIYRKGARKPCLTVEIDGDAFASYNFYMGRTKKAFGGHDGQGKVSDCRKEALTLALGIPTLRGVRQTVADESTLAGVKAFLAL